MLAAQTQVLSLPFSKRDIGLSSLQIVGASLFLALMAQLSIPLYFSPVPLSGQTFAIMLIGATLGSRKGFLSVLAYLMEGSFGLPFFAGGSCGFACLFGTTGGYFLGFLVQVYLIVWFSERQTSFKPIRTFFTLLVSSIVLLGIGSLWLSSFLGLEMALTAGFFPFLIGDVLKSIAVTFYLKVQIQCQRLKFFR